MEYTIIYKPKWSNFTRLSKTVDAFSYDNAAFKFYTTEEAKNCLEILYII